MEEILKCDHSSESYPAILSFGDAYYIRGFYLLSLWVKSLGVTIQMKATEQYFPLVLFIMLHKVVLTFMLVYENPKM